MPPSPSTKNYLNLCGFETGSLGEVASYSNVSVVSSPVNEGTYSLRCNPSGGTAYAQFGKITSNGDNGKIGVSTLYSRFNFYIATVPLASEEIFSTTTGLSEDTKFALRLTSDSKLEAYGSGGTALLATGTTVLALNTWYCIEVKVGTNSGGVGPWEVRIDENTELSGSDDIADTNNSLVALGKLVNRNGKSYDVYFDDFAMTDNEWIGMGVVSVLTPNGVGAEDFWVPSSGQAYQCIDEVPSNDDTDYIETTTLDDATTVAMSNLPGSVTTINCLKVVANLKNKASSTAATVSLRVRSGTSESDKNALLPTGGTYGYRCGLFANDPDTGFEWDGAAVNAIQSGLVYTSGDSGVRCSSLHVMADTSPPIVIDEDATGKLTFRGVATARATYIYIPGGRLTFRGQYIYGSTWEGSGKLRLSGVRNGEFVHQPLGSLRLTGVAGAGIINNVWSHEAVGGIRLLGSGVTDDIRFIIQIGDVNKFQALALADGATYSGSSPIVGFGAISSNTSGGDTVISQYEVPDLNVWTHLALVRSASNVYLYVDGVLVASASVAVDPSYGSTSMVEFGKGFTTGQGLDGSLDDVRVYGRPLTAGQVGTLAGGEDFSTADFSFSPAYAFNARGKLRVMGSVINFYQFTASGRLSLSGVMGSSADQMEPVFVIGGDTTRQALVVSSTYNAVTGFAALSSNNDSTEDVAATGVLPTSGQWYHLAMVRGPGYLNLYVNGVLVNTVATSDIASFGSNPKAWLGKLLSYRLRGKVDDARFYLRTLSGTEVISLASGYDLATASFELGTAYQARGALRIISETSGDFDVSQVGKLRLSGLATAARMTAHYDFYPYPTGKLVIKGTAGVASSVDNVGQVGGRLHLSSYVPVLRTTMRYTMSGGLGLRNDVQPAADFIYTKNRGRLIFDGHGDFFKLRFVQPVGKLRFTGVAEVALLVPYEASGKLGFSRLQQLRKLTGSASVSYSRNVNGSGSLRFKGSATVGFVQPLGGALTLSGSARAQMSIAVEGTGHLVLSGLATADKSFAHTMIGGFALRGTAGPVLYAHNAVGALTLFGLTNPVGTLAGQQATGRVNVTGLVTLRLGLPFEGLGQLTLSGVQVTGGTITQSASGRLTVSGSATVGGLNLFTASQGLLRLSGEASLTGIAYFPNYESGGRLTLSGVNKPASHYFHTASGALFLLFLRGESDAVSSASPPSVVEAGVPPIQLRSCSPDIDQRAFYLMIDKKTRIFGDLTDIGFGGWKLICYNHKTREGTIKIGDRMYVIKVPDPNATDAVPAPAYDVGDLFADTNHVGAEPTQPLVTVETLSQQSVLALLPEGRFKTYLSSLAADSWRVVSWRRHDRVVELQAGHRFFAVTLPDYEVGSSPEVVRPQAPLSSQPALGMAEWEEARPAPTKPLERSGGSGMRAGVSQQKFITLVSNPSLRRTLESLPLEEWQIRSFDKKNRKAELRVQNRYITVGV